MSEWIGPVGKVSKQSGRRGDFYILVIGGQEFFSFSDLPALNQGDIVRVEYESRSRKDGKGSINVIKSIQEVATPASAQAQKLANSDKLNIRLEIARLASVVFAGCGHDLPAASFVDFCEQTLQWISPSDSSDNEDAEATDEEVPF